MMLIGESGATKSSWGIAGKPETLFTTRGFRGTQSTSEDIYKILQEVKEQFETASSVNEIHLFCSGCLTDEPNQRVRSLLHQVFPSIRNSAVYSDLHAAGISTLKNHTGLGIILGTGSVAFEWDGRNPVRVFGGKGFPGGDFAGGADLGLRLLQCDHKEIISFLTKDEYELVQQLTSKKQLIPGEVGQLAKPVIRNKQNPLLKKLITRALIDFMAEIPSDRAYSRIGVSGSIGTFLQDELQEFFHSSTLFFTPSPIHSLLTQS